MTDETLPPPWVWDVLITLLEHRDTHPKYYQRGPRDTYIEADDCGCEPLSKVPVGMQRMATAIANDRARRGRE